MGMIVKTSTLPNSAAGSSTPGVIDLTVPSPSHDDHDTTNEGELRGELQEQQVDESEVLSSQQPDSPTQPGISCSAASLHSQPPSEDAQTSRTTISEEDGGEGRIASTTITPPPGLEPPPPPSVSTSSSSSPLPDPKPITLPAPPPPASIPSPHLVLQLPVHAQVAKSPQSFRPLLPSALAQQHRSGNLEPSTTPVNPFKTPLSAFIQGSSTSPSDDSTTTTITAVSLDPSTSTTTVIARFKPSPRDVISGIAPHVFDERRTRRRRSISPSSHVAGRRHHHRSSGSWYMGVRQSPLRRSVAMISWDEKSIWLEEATYAHKRITSRVCIDIATGQERTRTLQTHHHHRSDGSDSDSSSSDSSAHSDQKGKGKGKKSLKKGEVDVRGRTVERTSTAPEAGDVARRRKWGSRFGLDGKIFKTLVSRMKKRDLSLPRGKAAKIVAVL